MQFRVRPFVSTATLLLSTSLLFPRVGGAQTTATCKFTTFKPPSGYSWASPSGINDHGTIVGAVLSPPVNSTSFWRGLVRNPDGSMSTYHYPTVTPKNTWFTKINDSGVTVGYFGEYQFHGFVKSGNKVVKVDYPIGTAPPTSTELYGINKWGTIVGGFIAWPNGNFTPGAFKLQNGKFVPVKIPNSTYITAFGINDTGVIVGRYSKTAFVNYNVFYHGFVFHKDGTYKPIDHPTGLKHSGTELNDINSSGVIVGNWLSRDPQIGTRLEYGFIYKNGAFENIKYPNATVTTATGINNFGTIVGFARIPTNNYYNIVPFKATCQ